MRGLGSLKTTLALSLSRSFLQSRIVWEWVSVSRCRTASSPTMADRSRWKVSRGKAPCFVLSWPQTLHTQHENMWTRQTTYLRTRGNNTHAGRKYPDYRG